MPVEKFTDAGIDGGFVEQVFAVEGEKALEQFILIGDFRQPPLHQQAGAIADAGPHPVEGERREAEFAAQPVEGGGEVAQRVDQGAVEIEKEGGDGHCNRAANQAKRPVSFILKKSTTATARGET